MADSNPDAVKEDGPMKANQCRYCCCFADDLADVELRPDGESWKKCYPSRICGKCRKFLNETRQFRYKRPPMPVLPKSQCQETVIYD